MVSARFDKYLPVAVLQPYIKYFVISENPIPTTYSVLPDTSLVAGFQYCGRLLQTVNNTEHSLSSAGITGLQRQFKIFKNDSFTSTVLVYFSAIGASHFLRHPLHELFTESVSLDCFFPTTEMAMVQEQLQTADVDEQRIRIVEQFLLSHLQSTTPDALVTAAVQHICQSKGTIRMKRLAEMLYTSQSPLEKRFRKVVGTSPKAFASIVRFQTLIRENSPAESLTQKAYRAGYYDQAHFIKDFRSFTGQAPEQFFLYRQNNDFLQFQPVSR